MKTLIELYDERPLENILGAEMFHPETLIYLCPKEIAQDKEIQEYIINYLRHRNVDCTVEFHESSMFYTDKIRKQLESIVQSYPDCSLDITGGTDAALFAGGQVCSNNDMSAFTYSRKRNRFFSINNADFADNVPCDIQYKVEDFFKMAGGEMKQGRVDNAILDKYMDMISPFFSLFMRYRKDWKKFINYMQRASSTESLHVSSPFSVKGDHGSRIPANTRILREMARLGFIKKLKYVENESVSFDFKDEQIRNWFRDVGSVLELYVYKTCYTSGLFNDVITSAVVNWEDGIVRDAVSNEIDVVAVRGVYPVFISCKTCAIDTDALNELAILRDRFGGSSARAVVVSTERCSAAAHHRANNLNIDIIEYEDFSTHQYKEKLLSLVK